ncbi:MAG: carbon storage regulator CsrA [Christensenellales bacterium]
MLVLTRKAGEAISIGQGVTVEVIAIEGDRIRLGIQAPKETRIFRKELFKEVADINEAAANTPVVSFK